ncbi:oxidoreductase [Thermoclostridium stercorarium]|uniref:oxidoreductase n=1 Tax=Thermoclostridium stercorarium TaxID=1510 RepID=UPI000AE26624|nr:flavin oxidoreductase/NADH oxidase [Thermoclostridium stercorarium]
MEFRPFSYRNIEEFKNDISENRLDIPLSLNTEYLSRKVKIGGFTLANSLAINPMEGCDGKYDGSPDELTFRRYERFSRSGAALIWFEAVAVVPEGRTNPRQLWIHRNNVSSFRKLCGNIIENSNKEFGFTPLLIMQLTHSGRFSKPDGRPAPVIAAHNPYLDPMLDIDENYPVISDTELEQLEDKFVEAAVLAKEAGFHGVDVKCCHRYLNSELLSAFTRKGKYGETFEGRTRFLLNTVKKIRDRLGDDFIITTRLNIYDGIPYPYGFGVDKEDYLKPDFSEPVRLVKILKESGMPLINITMGTPYYNPHVNRPYDRGSYIPPEHPLEGICRLISGIGEIQKNVPDIAVVGTGYSWPREFAPFIAAGVLEKGLAKIIGFGRQSFAYPDFAKDILSGKGLIGTNAVLHAESVWK